MRNFGNAEKELHCWQYASAGINIKPAKKVRENERNS